MSGGNVMRKHPTWMPILALACLTVAVLAAGCDQPVRVAVLAGTITDALTGNPVAGARVVSGSKDAITNSDGQCVLQNLQPGTRPITVNAGGYATFSTVAVASGGLQQLDIKLVPESAPQNRFRDIDRLIASRQYVLATDRLEAMLDWLPSSQRPSSALWTALVRATRIPRRTFGNGESTTYMIPTPSTS